MNISWTSKSDLKRERDRLQKELEETEKELESLENQLDAEKERRKQLSRDKQEAEEKLNKLEDKLRSKNTEEEEDELETQEFDDIGFRKFIDGVEKLSTLKSEAEELVTVFSEGKLSDHDDVSAVKHSIPSDMYNELSSKEGLVVYHDSDTFTVVYRSRPFFSDDVNVSDSFKTNGIIDFVSREKHWVLVSRGETRILKESDGEVEEVERIKDRVNSQHGKGGFSQGRFERKRDEQVESHLENVEDFIEDLEDVYLLGDKSLCKDLTGTHLGGFDPNKSVPESLYQPRKLKD